MEESLEDYSYTSLPVESPHIRLLRIHTVSPEVVDCSLETHPLSAVSGRFNALSYVWGTQKFTATILCNGKRLYITPSLEETLRVLFNYQVKTQKVTKAVREKANCGHTDEDYLIWIDAICLNQSDSEEISAQIPLMGKIYSEAKTTFAYLGKSSIGSDVAFKLIPKINSILNHIESAHLKTMEEVLALGRYGYSFRHKIWEYLGELGRRPWCKRVWTLQEAALAKHLLIGCGDRWIEDHEFLSVYETLNRMRLVNLLEERSPICASKHDADGMSRYGGTLVGISILRFLPTKLNTLDLTEILNIARSRSCKEPIDHIWGIFGLLSKDVQNQIRDFGWIDKISTGREKYWESYRNFAKFCLRHDQNLRLLENAPSVTRPPQLPTWCPNWNCYPSCNPTILSNYQVGGPSWTPLFNLSHITESYQSDELCILGFRIDTVKSTVKMMPIWVAEDDYIGSMSPEVDQQVVWEKACLKLSQRVYGQFKSVPEAHWRTLVRGIINFEGTAITFNKDSYYTWKRCLLSYRAGIYDSPDQVIDVYDKFQDTMIYVNSGRQFISTQGGRVGLAGEGVNEGDAICVLYGGGPLFILRFEEDGRAKLIGDAYVHGLMGEGEAFASPDRGVDEEFVLI